MFRRLAGKTKPRLKLAQSLGAFTRPEQGDISPLYVFFEVTNAGRESAKVTRIYASPKGGGPAHDEPLEGDQSPPLTMEPGDTVRFWTRARTLARSLEEAGHTGRPRLRLVVEDELGNVHEKRFTFRVDEYARLRDE